jgi:beta-hydroxylase
MDKNNWLYKVIVYLGKKVISLFEHAIETFSGRIVYSSPYKINGVKELEKNVETILKEYVQIQKNRVIPGIDEFFKEQGQLASDGSWKSFPLFIYGNEFLDNTDLCPQTRKLLVNIKGFKSAMFSVLSANKKIPPHRGPFKGLLRIHLGLIVPKDEATKCFIEVGGERKYWTFGKTMMFDDTNIHAAYNLTEMDRVVLFIDVLRPLPWLLAFVNKFLFLIISNSPFITETKKEYQKFGNIRFSKLK